VLLQISPPLGREFQRLEPRKNLLPRGKELILGSLLSSNLDGEARKGRVSCRKRRERGEERNFELSSSEG